jgi:hypothetical protein
MGVRLSQEYCWWRPLVFRRHFYQERELGATIILLRMPGSELAAGKSLLR